MWIKLRMYLCIARGRMCHSMKICHLKHQCDHLCIDVCECVSADRVMSSAVLAQPSLLLLGQRNHGAPVIAVMPGHPWRLQDSRPLGDGAPQLFLDPTEPLQAVAVVTNRIRGDLKEKGMALMFTCASLFITAFWLHRATTASDRHTHMHACTCWQTHTHTAGPAQCLASWVITGLRSRFTAEAAASDFQHQHQHRALQLWFTNPITSIYGWK